MPVAVFTLLRLGLLVLAAVVLYAVGFRSWLLVLLATVVALALSYLLLTRQRDAAARYLADRAERRRHRPPTEDELAEDELADRASASSGSGPSVPADGGSAPGGSDREADAEQDPVSQLEHPGTGEDRSQQHAPRTEQDGPDQQPGGQRQQQHQE